MAFLFHRKKSPSELIKSVRKHLEIVSSAADAHTEQEFTKSMEKIAKYLHGMKVMMLGDPEAENPTAVDEDDSNKLTDELLSSELLLGIIRLSICGKLPFESRKDAAAVATYVLHHRTDQSIDFLKGHPDLVRLLTDHYSSASSEGLPDVALECGALLREAIHHAPIANVIIHDQHTMDSLFSLTQASQFDVASDAWETFRLLLTEPKSVVSSYFDAHYDDFVAKFNTLLLSDNFMTKRQSLKLLSDLLVSRSNYNFMMRFTSSTTQLKHIMNLCRTKSLCVQLEAFNVLKLFVANPKKSEGVVDILSRNRAPLIAFLKRIAEGVTEEEEKNGNRYDEAAILISELEKLPEPEQFSTSPKTPSRPSQLQTHTLSSPMHANQASSAGLGINRSQSEACLSSLARQAATPHVQSFIPHTPTNARA